MSDRHGKRIPKVVRNNPSHGGPARQVPAHRASKQSTDWDQVADWYDALVGDEGSEYQQEVIIPGILRLLESADADERPVKNQKSKIKTPLRILDLACGQGVLCRKLAALGHDVTGIDASETLIAAARRRTDGNHPPIRYVVADVTKLLSDSGELAADLAPASFDVITLILAVQNLTPLSPIWQACKAALKPSGTLILVMMHPCFRIPRQSDWLWESIPDGTWQSRLIRRYLSSEKIEIQAHPGLAAHGKDDSATTHFHRPLQAYINTLGNAGLLIDHIEEWISHKTSQPGPRKAALDRARKEIPMFLAIRTVKL